MPYRTVIIFLFLFCSIAPVLMADDKPELITQIERTEVYKGEAVLYRLTLNNVKNPSRPVLKELDDFQVTNGTERNLNSSSISIVNNRVTRVERRGMSYDYLLIPIKKGRLRVPAPEFETDGITLKGKAFTINVIGPEEQDLVIIEIDSDRKTVYPLLPFTVVLKIYIKALPAPYSKENPISFQRNPPALSIPWISDPSPGLIPSTDWRQWLAPYENRSSFFTQASGGFTINSISSVFMDAATYTPKNKIINRPDSKGKQTPYWEFTLERTFISRKVGDFHLGPVTLKGMFGTDVKKNGTVNVKSTYAMAAPLILTVKDAPLEGRPDGYTGAIGTFDFSGEIAPTTARVGDPMTLTLRLKGQGTLDRARAPDIEKIPGIAENFKIYEATEETRGKVRTFTYSLRPLNGDIKSFPSVPLAYFDVDRERYVTANSKNLPLTIKETDQLNGDDIVFQGRNGNGADKRIEAKKEGIFANRADLHSLKNEKVRPDIYATLIGCMALFYFIMANVTRKLRKASGDIAGKRRRAAANRARSRIRDGVALIHSGNLNNGAEIVRAAMMGLVADLADITEAGLTVRDFQEQISSHGVSKDTAEKAIRLLERCDAAQFGAPDSEAVEIENESEQVLTALLKELKKEGRFR